MYYYKIIKKDGSVVIYSNPESYTRNEFSSHLSDCKRRYGVDWWWFLIHNYGYELIPLNAVYKEIKE